MIKIKKLISLFLIIVFCISPINACSTAFNKNEFAFQRDSIEAANITVQNISGNLVQSKPGFIHCILYSNGDFWSKGGSDSKIANFFISNICILAHEYNIPKLVYLAAPFIYYSKGHLVFKHGNSAIIQCYTDGIYFNEVTLSDAYIVVSNSVNYINEYRVNSVRSALESHLFSKNHRFTIDYSNGIQIIDPLDNITVC